MTPDDIPFDVQALAMSRKWNPDLIPGERRLAAELAAAATTMRRLATLTKARPDLLELLGEHP